MFRSLLKIFKEQPKTRLGRWNLKNNSEITNTFANYDHCGDIICKNPKEITNSVDIIKNLNHYSSADMVDYIDYSYLQQKNRV